MKRIYHYTTKENLLKILASKMFIASTPWGSDDSAFGPGWYFTHLTPETDDKRLAHLWLRKDLDNEEAEAYLVYEVHESFLKFYPKRGDVYKLEYDLIVGDHLQIDQTYLHGTEIVIKYVGHGYRDKKKESEDVVLNNLLRTAQSFESQKLGLDSTGRLCDSSTSAKFPSNSFYHDPLKDF